MLRAVAADKPSAAELEAVELVAVLAMLVIAALNVYGPATVVDAFASCVVCCNVPEASVVMIGGC